MGRVNPEERNRIIDQKEKYPAVLSPFQEEERIEPSTPIGLRYNNEVVGWMITHRTKA